MHRMDTSRRKQVYQSTNWDQMCLRKGSIPQSKIYTDHQHYNFCWKTLSLSIYVNTTGDLGRAHRGPHLTKHSADLLPDNTGHHQSTVGPTNAWSCGIQRSWQPGWHLELSSGQCHCCWGGTWPTKVVLAVLGAGLLVAVPLSPVDCRAEGLFLVYNSVWVGSACQSGILMNGRTQVFQQEHWVVYANCIHNAIWYNVVFLCFCLVLLLFQ